MFENINNNIDDKDQKEEEHFKRKQPLFEELKDKIYYNADFVSRETYKEIFDGLDLKGKTILELGCGFIPLHDQTYLREMDGRGANLIPIDRDSVRMSSWTLPLSSEGRESQDETIIQPIQADIEDLPFVPSSVDGCISINLLNATRSVEEVKALTDHVYQVLKDGGFFLASTFGYLKFVLEDGSVKYNDNFSVGEIMSVEEIKKIIKESGFREIKDIPLDKEMINKISSLGAEQLLQDYFVEGSLKPVSSEFIESMAILAQK